MMVLMLLAALAAVEDSVPSEGSVDLSAGAGRPSPADDAELAEQRIARFSDIGRSARSEALARGTFAAADTEPTTTTAAPTTTSTAPPTTAAPTTTARPKPTTTTTAAPTTTTVKPPTTAAPTTAPPSTTTTMGPPPPCCREEGGASYHDYADARTCAHKSLPKGTALTVTNLSNAKTTTCVVNDRGPYVEGRIIDLSKTAFAEIAAISDGVIRVSIEW